MTDSRQTVSETLEVLRKIIKNGELLLFIGERTSSLFFSEQKSWWDFKKSVESEGKDFVACTDELEAKVPTDKSRILRVLRTLGRFPVILTTNMDHMIEGYFLKEGEKVEICRLDQIKDLSGKWPNETRTLLIKLNGSASYRKDAAPVDSLKDYFNGIDTKQDDTTSFLQSIFNQNSTLFLGFDREQPNYANFLKTFIENSKKKHYLFEPVEKIEGGNEKDKIRLLEKGSLNVIQTVDMEVAEFAQYLTPGEATEEIDVQPGQVYEKSFLPTQREAYLKQQLFMEQKAVEINFQTMQVTNALTTDELLEAESRPGMTGIFTGDPFVGHWDDKTVDDVITAMKNRKENLVQLLKKGVKVTSLFSFTKFLSEVMPKEGDSPEVTEKRRKCIRKYGDVILMSRSVLNSKSSLELRVIEQKEELEKQLQAEQFALIRLRAKDNETTYNEAICYANPAVTGKKTFSLSMVSVNSSEVSRKRRIFEELREGSWDHDKALLKLTLTLLQANRKLNALKPKAQKDLESLHSINAITESEIEPGTLEPIGEGNFGTVYKAKFNKEDVAVKVLKKIERAEDLKSFIKEYENLKEARHPNIVQSIKCFNDKQQIGIIMEYMDGGSVRDALNKTPDGQSVEFTKTCAKQVAEALSFMHKKRIIHRDIKVDNVFMSKDQKTFKIGDFGLATVTAGTNITKTQNMGSFRYMAPEVQTLGGAQKGKYSSKADVYSYGLMLIEIMTGQLAFADQPIHEEVYRMKGLGIVVTIPEECKKDDQLHRVILHCVQHNSLKRLNIDGVLDILNESEKTEKPITMTTKPTMSTSPEIEIVCLGTGKGATAIMTGYPSSSFVVTVKGEPLLWVDMGFGVTKGYNSHIGKKPPQNVYITHNHLDHSGEMPVTLYIMMQDAKKQGISKSPVRLLAQEDVMTRLRDHRMHEMQNMGADIEDYAHWTTCNEGIKTPLDKCQRFSLEPVESQHGEICYGFVLYDNDSPILGYTADSGLNTALFEKVFQAPVVVADARENGTTEHAGFDEVQKFAESKKKPKVYIIGHGTPEDEPADGKYPNLEVLQIGQRYSLDGKPIKPATLPLDGGDLQQTYPSTRDALQPTLAEENGQYPLTKDVVTAIPSP